MNLHELIEAAEHEVETASTNVRLAREAELHAHRHGSIADQQTARQALWDAQHALEVARLSERVLRLNLRANETGYAQDVDDAVDAEAWLARVKAGGPRRRL